MESVSRAELLLVNNVDESQGRSLQEADSSDWSCFPVVLRAGASREAKKNVIDDENGTIYSYTNHLLDSPDSFRSRRRRNT